ncbi:uncharacterized [Tachysurus ichikawai]
MLCCGGGSQGITVTRCTGGRGQAHGVTVQTSSSRQSAERDSDTDEDTRPIIFVLLRNTGRTRDSRAIVTSDALIRHRPISLFYHRR